jgi:hypothetical protein
MAERRKTGKEVNKKPQAPLKKTTKPFLEEQRMEQPSEDLEVPHHVPTDEFGCPHSGIFEDKLRHGDIHMVKNYVKQDKWLCGVNCVDCDKSFVELMDLHKTAENNYKSLSKEEKVNASKVGPFGITYCDIGCGAHGLKDDHPEKKERTCYHAWCRGCLGTRVKEYENKYGVKEGSRPK